MSFIFSIFLFRVVFATQNCGNIALSSIGAKATAISEGTYMGTTHYASNLVDGNVSTGWNSNWSMPAWVKIELDTIYEINAIDINCGTHKHTFSISVSTNGTNWTTVIPTRSSNNIENGSLLYELFPIHKTTAKYIKIEIISTSAHSSHIFQAIINEIDAFYEDCPYLSESPNNQNVSYSAGNTSFSILSNINWNANDDASWLTLSPTSGTGNSSVIADYDENYTSSSRTATISFTGSGVSTKYVTLVQAGISPSLSVAPTSQSVGSNSGNTSFTVTSNVNWTVSDDVSWLTLNPANGNGNSLLTATFLKNNTSSIRTATITVSATGASD